MKIRLNTVVAGNVLAVALITGGCATNDSLSRGQTGAAIGAVAGAVLGHQVDGDKGRFLGAAVGALAGNAVGRYMDEQQQELEAQLSQERANREIEISRLQDNTLKVNLSSEVSFDTNSANIKADFQTSLNKLAGVLSDYPETAIHIVGHTDSTGTEQYNQKLSERRAASVNGYLAQRGVAPGRTRTIGYGESLPISDNNSEQGRQRNRRVEIFLKPIVEGQEASAFVPPV